MRRARSLLRTARTGARTVVDTRVSTKGCIRPAGVGVEDAGDACDGLPKDCTPECANTFMPFFSRCGKTIFADDEEQVGHLAPAAGGRHAPDRGTVLRES